jgi:hypothetical protein
VQPLGGRVAAGQAVANDSYAVAACGLAAHHVEDMTE